MLSGLITAKRPKVEQDVAMSFLLVEFVLAALKIAINQWNSTFLMPLINGICAANLWTRLLGLPLAKGWFCRGFQAVAANTLAWRPSGQRGTCFLSFASAVRSIAR